MFDFVSCVDLSVETASLYTQPSGGDCGFQEVTQQGALASLLLGYMISRYLKRPRSDINSCLCISPILLQGLDLFL